MQEAEAARVALPLAKENRIIAEGDNALRRPPWQMQVAQKHVRTKAPFVKASLPLPPPAD